MTEYEIAMPGINEAHKIVDELATQFRIPRSQFPSNTEITDALNRMPKYIQMIPDQLRGKFLAQMVMATSVGLFDGAIVYIWNNVIQNLRSRVNSFGSGMIKKMFGDNTDIDDITDANLIDLSYKLGLISEQGKMFLHQCREIRNNASVAHPTDFLLDDDELTSFINRCCKYGLSQEVEQNGLEFNTVMSTITNEEISTDALDMLAQQLTTTFELQRNFYIELFYKQYSSADTKMPVRNNIERVIKNLNCELNDDIKTNIISAHNTMLISSKQEDSSKYSRSFISQLGLMDLITEGEKIAVIKRAVYQLNDIHNAMNNFYNEPAFAEKLNDVIKQIFPIPEVIISEYIDVVFNCFVGTQFGVSNQAIPFYWTMLTGLTPKGIDVLLHLVSEKIKKSGWTSSQLNQMKKIVLFFDGSQNLTPSQKNVVGDILNKRKDWK